jgi:hypothetical protein
LPVVAFLLVGYADNLSALAGWLGRRWSAAAVPGPPATGGPWSLRSALPLKLPFTLLCVLAPALVALAISARHRRWQAPGRAALTAAVTLVREVGGREIGLTPDALKVGMLFRGPTPLVLEGRGGPRVVLCSEQSSSYRTPANMSNACALPGYAESSARGGFHVLVRPGP